MPTTTSSKLAVAIIGATGRLGPSVAKAFLDLHPETFGRVVILTRNPQSESAKALEVLGAELLQVEGVIHAGALQGVDVLVNTSGSGVPANESDALFKEATASGVRVYFPPEFGIDRRTGSRNHIVWHEKERHSSAARSEAPGQLKVINVHVGLFTDRILLPILGFDIENGVFTSLGVGTSDNKVSITSRADIGAAVARLSVLAVADPTSVPDAVRISGENRSINELAEIVGRATGKKIKVVEEPVKWIDDKDGEDLPALAHLVRVNCANGLVDFSKDNDDELVNPGQKYWTWMTTEAYARDVIAK
ncbi:hypothetical protein FRB96_006646 [Tulasnella sp. 330]|nr:hypothetical protein FRB96_006646 [Tulasnella sp. 330]KAG8873645.1 hypothetical protein FRB97_006565 [Tulasnella sp. 331]KAG8888429.1 hypothetical protein FRB98_007641 [Tulasnella sp. 332]